MLTEIRKGVIIGFLLTILYGIIIYIYENQNKNNVEIKTEEKESLQNNEKSSDNKNKESATVTINIENQKNGKYYIYNGYEYKKTSKNEKSTFIKRNLGYEKKFSKTTTQEEIDNELKTKYCDAVEEIKKGIVIGLLLTSFYGIGVYTYKSKNKNEMITKIQKINNTEKENEENTRENYEVYGYEYKNKGDVESKFLKKNLGYEKKIREAVNKEEVYNELKLEYCAAITEIKKVDKGIMSGTNIPFTQVSYMQVEDAYKEYLQKIAQIKQAISLTIENKDIERETGCYYEPTRWDRVNNLNYRLKNFL